jgi:hypothetical protein
MDLIYLLLNAKRNQARNWIIAKKYATSVALFIYSLIVCAGGTRPL